MVKQLDLFQKETDFQTNNIVNCDFLRGLDLKQSIIRCYTGGNYGFILSINKFRNKANVYFPPRVEEHLSFIKEEWFEFDLNSLSLVTTFGFQEDDFRKVYHPKALLN